MNQILKNCLAIVVGLVAMIAIVGALEALKAIATNSAYLGYILGAVAIVVMITFAWIMGSLIMVHVRGWLH